MFAAQGSEVCHGAVVPQESMSPRGIGGAPADDLTGLIDGLGYTLIGGREGSQVGGRGRSERPGGAPKVGWSEGGQFGGGCCSLPGRVGRPGGQGGGPRPGGGS